LSQLLGLGDRGRSSIEWSSNVLRRDVVLERLGEAFTDRSRRVVDLSLERFAQLGNSTYNSTDLLHGLYLESDGVAFHVLDQFDFGRKTNFETPVDLPVTLEGEFNIEPELSLVANEIATSMKRMSHRYIGTEHLLLGVAASGTKSARMLTELGIRPADLANELYNLLGYGLESGVD
jgi:ATP-dependent Clp protease ATP-binding subunit ClpA